MKRTDPIPYAARRALSKALRSKIENTLALLIEILDTVDGDPDIEPKSDDDCCTAGDDDPSTLPSWGVPYMATAPEMIPMKKFDVTLERNAKKTMPTIPAMRMAKRATIFMSD